LAVKLRLRRIGKKKQPFYRIVAIDSKAPRDGSYLDKIGHYNPVTQPAEVVIDRTKAMAWLNDGATPSDTVNSLFRRDGILHEWELRKRGASEEQVIEELGKWQDLQVQRGKRLEAKAAMAKRESEEKKPAKAAAAPAESTKPVEKAAPAAAPAVEEPAVVAEVVEAPAAPVEPAAASPVMEEPAVVAEAAEVPEVPEVPEVAEVAEVAEAPAEPAVAAEASTEPKSEV
jgi:small subunit ribosomal protein S16